MTPTETNLTIIENNDSTTLNKMKKYLQLLSRASEDFLILELGLSFSASSVDLEDGLAFPFFERGEP